MNRTVICLSVVSGLLAAMGVARAQDDGWNYTLTPYVWMAGLDGDVGTQGAAVSVDERFKDVLDKLDLAVMLGGEAHNGTWGVFADGMYMDLKDDETTDVGKVEVQVQQWLASAGALYRVAANEKLTVDAGLGGRYVDTKLDIDTPAGKVSGSRNWIDPIVAARLRLQVATRVFVQLAGDIGGFGVESDLVWQLTGTAGYQFTERLTVLLGYRHLDYDYRKDGMVYDVATSGLGLGLTVGF